MEHEEKKLTKKAVRTALELVKNPQQGVMRIFEAEERARDAKADAKRWEERAKAECAMNRKMTAILGVVASRMLGVSEIGDLPDVAPSLTLTEDDFNRMDGLSVKVEFLDKKNAEDGKPFPARLDVVRASDEFEKEFDEQTAELPPVVRDAFKNMFAGMGAFNANGESERSVQTPKKEPEGAM